MYVPSVQTMNILSNLARLRSPQTNVTVWALIIFLFSIWSLTGYVNWTLRRDMQPLLSEQQFSIASLIAEDVNDELKERIRALKLIANAIQAPLLNEPALLQTYVDQLPLLELFFNAGIFVIRLDGTAVAEVPSRNRVGVNFMDRDHIAVALNEGKISVSSPDIDQMSGAPAFIIVVPILDPQGKTIGALGGVIDLTRNSFFDKRMDGKYAHVGSYLIVSPQSRLIVTASDKKRILEPLPAAGLHSKLDLSLEGEQGTSIFLNMRGVEVLSSAKNIPIVGWRAVVSMPTDEIFAPIKEMQLRFWLAAIILTILASSLAWWILGYRRSLMLTAVKLKRATDSLHIANVEKVKNKRISEEFRNLSLYDPLTQLANRRLWDDRLEQAMASSRRSACYFAVMVLDLDHFKQINDAHGHAAGDLLLLEAARRLTDSVREIDTIARTGGDEFAMILSELNVDKATAIYHAKAIAEKIRINLARPYQLLITQENTIQKTIVYHCSVSIGVTVLAGKQTSRENMMSWADKAMYDAKKAGRNRVQFHVETV